MNGGYQVFDLQGANITSAGVKIEGLHEFLEGRKKTVILENLVIDGEEKGSVFCGILNEEPIQVTSIEGYQLTITSEDLVSKI